MTSRELVYRTLDFQRPERIPRHLWVLPWAEINHPIELRKIMVEYPDDIVYAPVNYHTPPISKGEYFKIGSYIDEWGCQFENIHEGIIGEVKTPLIREWKDLDNLRTPRELLTFDREKVNEFCRTSDKFVIAGGLARPFERMQWLRTTEQFFMDLALYPKEVLRMRDIIHSFFMEEMELWCNTEVDAVWFMDDWGSQNSLLISPVMWRKFFAPCYKDYIDLAHSKGKKIFFHSDGYILDILPDLIEMGLDAINSQVFCMDPVELGRRFAGKITFWGELDRQHLLPDGTSGQIRSAAKILKKAFYRDGGFIVQCEFGPAANPANILEYFEELHTALF